MPSQDLDDLEGPTTEEAPLESGKCKICRAAAASSMYGIPSCRVCKGIFKRGIKKKFTCAHDNGCVVKASVKERCKACIYAKCLRKGMVPPAPTAAAAKDSGSTPPMKPTKPTKTPKNDKVSAASQLPPKTADLPAAAPVERYYEVKEDLKALFEPTTAKPFRFFDNDETAAEVDEFAATESAFDGERSINQRHHFFGNDEEDYVNDQALPSTFTGSTFTGSVLAPRQSFFFSENDPRLAEGMRFLTLNAEEMATSLEEWKKTRPQIFADFKKLKKDANRKRKTFDR
ncbi:hypothetical protein BV898_05007 [Hypsibius exemplaris]|uniref:Nuclear receptor domain-containing protein n=1 Tax=Hypsibius exemplaris TaxID=2072580 RepID=A0A1W0X0W3_HYPEX|nr:hypothetical protein BV898_05007 [Hypsibius exemplaris]